MEVNVPQMAFGQAREALKKIFPDILGYIDNVDSFVKNRCQSGWIEGIEMEKQKRRKEKLKSIMGKIDRNRMKVVFFGKTSCGKSTMINAMLREDFLPTGFDHTTNCFLQVEGRANIQEPFLLIGDERHSVQSIRDLADALSETSLSSGSLIRICWPRERFRLLREDVVLVDSPGIDVTEELDTNIDSFYQNADVCVLVSNADGTLTQTEKNFLLRVKLSISNVFILWNKWDNSVHERDARRVQAAKERKIAMSREFLVELEVTHTDRVFFVSAREALALRLNQDKGTTLPNGIILIDSDARLDEFETFERRFEECISMSAIRRHFEQYAQEGRNVTRELKSLMDRIFSLSLEQLNRKKADYKQRHTSFLNVKIKAMVKDFKSKVSTALNEKIQRQVSLLVKKFKKPFHSDPGKLTRYKRELHEHVDNGLRCYVQDECSAVLKSEVGAIQKEMTELFSHSLNDETVLNSVLRHDFRSAYSPVCHILTADFKEDLEFHFLTPKNIKTVAAVTTVAVAGTAAVIGVGVVAGPVVAAELVKTIAIAATGPVGGLVPGVASYVHDRLSWSDEKKKQVFKKQFVDYVGNKLHLIVDETSSNCIRQIQHLLNSKFASLPQNVDTSVENLAEEIKNLDTEISQLGEVKAKAEGFRHKADWLDNKLKSFTEQYLKETVL